MTETCKCFLYVNTFFCSFVLVLDKDITKIMLSCLNCWPQYILFCNPEKFSRKFFTTGLEGLGELTLLLSLMR